jgi:acyl carrier protein phosphodiesterase
MRLEVYAAKLFNDFCKNQGLDGRWDYLSPKRKLVWISEAHHLLRTSVQELRASFKPLKQMKPQASYEIGYYQGMSAERLATLSYLDHCIEDLAAQYEDLNNKYNK